MTTSGSGSHSLCMLGTGLIGTFYTRTLHEGRRPDRVGLVYSRSEERARSFAETWDIPRWTVDLEEAISDPETDVVVNGLPNYLHLEVVERLVAASTQTRKAILSTKPLGRNLEEATRMLRLVEEAGLFNGYLEDLVYTPKTRKALEAVRAGALGQILWARSRESHPGPHSAWFWDLEKAGGGALVDIGCHCIEILRSYLGKEVRPVEAMCWTDTLVHPIEAEDHGIALIRFATGAVGQFEVSWAFRGGLDIRDEVSGTEGTIWLDHFQRTGFEMYTGGGQGYVAEKSEAESGWVFPVGDEIQDLGYANMFLDMLEALDSDRPPVETFYDGYVVQAILDACYRSAKSRRWEAVELVDWRGRDEVEKIRATATRHDGQVLIKRERLPDGRVMLILKDEESGDITSRVADGEG